MSTIDQYTLKDGSKRYRVQYAKPDGKRTVKRGFKTKREARHFAATVEVDKATGSFVPYSAGLVRLEEVGKAWRSSLISSSVSWRERQESAYFTHVKPYWGDVKLKDITPAGIQEWVNQQVEREKPLAAKTVRTNLGVLQAVLDIAVNERRIYDNPARKHIKLPRTAATDKVYLTADQVHALADEVPDSYKTLFWFLVTSGVRFGEAAALRPMDLVGNGLVRLRRAYSKVGTKSVLTDLKGHAIRTVAVPPAVEAELLKLAEGKPHDALLWEAPRKGGPLQPPRPGHWLGAAVSRCHEADSTFPEHLAVHSLRHTAASLLISSGANVKVVQQQLGHKSATMTLDQYGHLFPHDLGTIAEAMDTILFQPSVSHRLVTESGGTASAATKSPSPAKTSEGHRWSRRELNPGPSSPRQGFSVRSLHRISTRPSGSGKLAPDDGPSCSRSPQPAEQQTGQASSLVDARI